MDGGRGVLRSLIGAVTSLAPVRPALAGFPSDMPQPQQARPAPAHPSDAASERLSRSERLLAFARRPGLGSVLTIALLAGSGIYGAVRGGSYADFVAEEGSLSDVMARAIGFGIDGVTISGAHEMSERDILASSGITTRDSLLFLDVAAIRARLKETPLVRDVSVRKLYPGRLAIDVQERVPFAVWQAHGQVQIVSADGMAIDQFNDERFTKLPFVVGEDANLRVPEYLKIVEAGGELRDQVRVGMLVGGRRWNLQLKSGLEIKLPEADPRCCFREVRPSCARDAHSRERPDFDRLAHARPDGRAPDRRGRSGPRRHAPQAPRQGRPDVSSHSLTPRMRPLSARRSAVLFGAGRRKLQGRLPDRAADARGGLGHAARAHASLPHPRHRSPEIARHQGGAPSSTWRRPRMRSGSRSTRPNAWRACRSRASSSI